MGEMAELIVMGEVCCQCLIPLFDQGQVGETLCTECGGDVPPDVPEDDPEEDR